MHGGNKRKQCRTPGCEKRAQSKGLCCAHGGGYYKNGQLITSKRTNKRKSGEISGGSKEQEYVAAAEYPAGTVAL